MKQWRSLGWVLAAAALVAFTTPLMAADDSARTERPGMTEKAGTGEFTPKLTKVNWIIGHDLVNAKSNDTIGRVENIIFDQSLQRARFVIVSTGSVLGMGGKFHAVPWSAFIIQPENKKVMTNADKARLQQAPSFDRSNWPNFDSEELTTRVRDYWGRMKEEGMTTRTPEEAKAALAERIQDIKYRKASELIGLNVKNRQDENLGDIEDLVLDLREGALVYAYLGFGGFLGMGEKMAAIPWSAIDVQPQRNIARVDADKSLLQSIAFESSKEPNLANRDEATRLYQRFNETPYWEMFGYTAPEGERAGMRWDAWKKDSKYYKNFDAKKIEDISGTIESIGSYHPEPGSAPGMRLRVKTDDGKTVTVYGGPHLYGQSKKIYFSTGDKVTVTGSRTKVSDREVLLATQIKKGDQTLEILDKSTGEPQYNTDDLQRMHMGKGDMKSGTEAPEMLPPRKSEK